MIGVVSALARIASRRGAAYLSLDIVKDGVENLARVTGDLMDQRPTAVSREEPLELDRKVRQSLAGLPWVASADARLREARTSRSSPAPRRSQRSPAPSFVWSGSDSDASSSSWMRWLSASGCAHWTSPTIASYSMSMMLTIIPPSTAAAPRIP